ncbi:probable 3-hydroxyisobutyrate dehydrogenase, mitochondrial [Prorops nasuta]|uniref:probable 3-hydroxyisobutyrate dehydrogenase, mitochondrial n=1 Tax=Prorops nasuta TaxID=863751 RepID=UPI0034CF5084
MTWLVFKSLTRRTVNSGMRRYSNIGFVGLGNMGNYMAKHLIKKGFKLTVYDINKASVNNLVEAGAVGAANVAEMSANAEVVISMLPSNQTVLDSYIGENSIINSVKPNTLLIDSSTVDPEVSQTVAKKAVENNSRFIDGPVSGGVIGARDATLTFMVGGSKDDFEDAKPVLQAMGSKIVHCGQIGMGEAAKLCNNMLLGISMIGTSEAFNLGQKLGLDAKVFYEIVNSSTGRCWSTELYNPVPGLVQNVPSGDNYENGFSTTLIAKDLGLAQAAATKVEAPIPLGSLAHQVYRSLILNGYSTKDFSVVYQFLKGLGTGKKH